MDNWRISHLLELLKDEPKNEFVQFALAQEYTKTGNLQEALNYYTTLRQQNEDYVGLYYHLAALYQELGKTDQALQTYDAGIIIARKIQDHHALSELMNAKSNLEIEM